MRTRARIEWSGKPSLENVAIDLRETGGGDELRDWSGSFSIPVEDLRKIDVDAEDVRVTLEDGRSGRALVSLRIDADGAHGHFRGAGALE